MNPFLILQIVGGALLIESALMSLPLIAAFYYNDPKEPFIIPMILAAIIGLIFVKLKRDNDKDLVSKEGFVSTGLTWIALSLVGMLPFLISGAIPSPIDAFFETVSGFTTTGSSILKDVEALSHSMLMWRSFMHWIGGMGIVVFMAAIVHYNAGSQMMLVKAESPGPIVEKLVPKASDTAKILYGIYTIITLITFAALALSGMPKFDAVCISFGCAGTGGFAVLNSGLSSYTPLQQIIVTISMISFGVNFNAYFMLLINRSIKGFKSEEIRMYFLIIVCAICLITIDLIRQGAAMDYKWALRDAAFHVGSIITTTGFAIDDINTWPTFSQTILVLLMFVGACAGSTGGGFKISRLVLMLKSFKREIMVHLNPDMIKKVHFDGKAVDERVLRSTGTYTFAYLFILLMSILIISLNNKSYEVTVTSVIATFNNIGPGLGEIGTVGNYSGFSALSKLTLCADMLIGRLEIFPIIALLRKQAWRKF